MKFPQLGPVSHPQRPHGPAGWLRGGRMGHFPNCLGQASLTASRPASPPPRSRGDTGAVRAPTRGWALGAWLRLPQFPPAERWGPSVLLTQLRARGALARQPQL